MKAEKEPRLDLHHFSFVKSKPALLVSVTACTPLSPIFTGLFFTLLDFLRLREIALRLEDLWGGRVGTLITSNPRATDPFVLLAHHRHSFWPLDPFRLASSLIIPEGFPAHPHRGFQTVTYVMRVRAWACSCRDYKVPKVHGRIPLGGGENNLSP